MSVQLFCSRSIPATATLTLGGCALAVGGIFMLLASLQVLPHSVNVLSNLGGQLGGAVLISFGALTLGVIIARHLLSLRSRAHAASDDIQQRPVPEISPDRDTKIDSGVKIPSKSNFTGTMPIELTSAILEYCSRQEWLKARSVCSAWRTLADRFLIKHKFGEPIAQKLFSLSGDWSHLAANVMASTVTKKSTHQYSSVGQSFLLQNLLARDPLQVADLLRLGVNPLSEVQNQQGDKKPLILHFIASYDIALDRKNPKFLYILFLLLRFLGTQITNNMAVITKALFLISCTEGLKLLKKLEFFSLDSGLPYGWHQILNYSLKIKNLSMFKFIHENQYYKLISWKNDESGTLLHACAREEAEEIELYLIKIGIPIDLKDMNGKTYSDVKRAYHNEKNCCAIANYVINSKEAETPLESQLGHLEGLLSQCSDLNVPIDSFNNTILTKIIREAFECSHLYPEQQIKLLIHRGADPYKKGWMDRSAYEYLKNKLDIYSGNRYQKWKPLCDFMESCKKEID